MSARALRRARLLRGLAVSVSGAGLGIGGHLLAGGHPPVSAALLLTVALAADACTLLSDRQWSLGRLLVALGAVQLLVHASMGLQMRHTAAPVQAAHGAGGWLMLGAHAGAALVTAWLLRRGEAMFWRVVERLRPRPTWPTVAAPFDLSRPTPSRRRGAAVPGKVPLTGSVARRGPPALVAA